MTRRRLEVSGNTALEEAIDDASTGRVVVLTVRNRARAVLVPARDLADWEETLAILADPDTMKQLRSSARDVTAGRVRRFAEVTGRTQRR